jgi:hypothetical protein
VSLLFNDGNGSFANPVNLIVGDIPVGISSGDIDGDGSLDLAVANSSSNTISLFFNDGSGEFGIPQSLFVGAEPITPLLLLMDGDDILDLVVSSRAASHVGVFLGNRDEDFIEQVRLADGQLSPQMLIAGDFNQDGVIDLGVSFLGKNQVSFFLSSP